MDGDRFSSLTDVAVSRRGAMAVGGAALGSTFALSVQPVCAQTMITTSTDGLTAGVVKVKTKDGKEMDAYRAMPATGQGFGTILVVPEIWGVHAHIADVCRRFAKAGYYAIASELYFRQGDPKVIPDTQALIRDIVAKVPDEQVMNDLDSSVAFVKGEGKGDTAKLGVTGFCWGGRIVWLYAATNPGLKAGVAWYGRVEGPPAELQPRNPLDLVRDMKAPVLGLYGGEDAGIPSEGVERMRTALKAAGKPSEIHTYPGMPHGFHADYRPSYRKAAADDGWKRMLDWFGKHGVA